MTLGLMVPEISIFKNENTRLNFDIQISVNNIDKVKQQIKRTSKMNFWKFLSSNKNKQPK